MNENFNTYIEHIDVEVWREFCVSKGKLRHFAKGEEFVSIGKVGRYIGFIQSGTLPENHANTFEPLAKK